MQQTNNQLQQQIDQFLSRKFRQFPDIGSPDVPKETIRQLQGIAR